MCMQTDRMQRLILLNLILLANFIPMTQYGFVKFYGRQVSLLIDFQLQKLRLIYPLKIMEKTSCVRKPPDLQIHLQTALMHFASLEQFTICAFHSYHLLSEGLIKFYRQSFVSPVLDCLALKLKSSYPWKNEDRISFVCKLITNIHADFRRISHHSSSL